MSAEPPEQVGRGVRLAGAYGDEYAEGDFLELADRMQEEPQGRAIGPLRVVDDQDQPGRA